MYYTVDIDNNIESLAYCLNHVYKWIEDVWEWTIKINSALGALLISNSFLSKSKLK